MRPAALPLPVNVLDFILAREGVNEEKGWTGYVNDPDDRGGATNYGITQGTYDAWRASQGLESISVKRLTRWEVAKIYEARYWVDGQCDRILERGREKLALAHMDACVNHGLTPAAKMLQAALRVVVDGVIGPKTLAAVAEADELRVIGRYLIRRAAFYRTLAERRPTSRKFLYGWLARLRWVARATGVPIDHSYEQSEADR